VESITYLLQYSTMQLMVLVGFPGCLLDLEQTGLTKVLSECRGLTVLPSLSLLLLFPLLASPQPSLCPPSPLPTSAQKPNSTQDLGPELTICYYGGRERAGVGRGEGGQREG